MADHPYRYYLYPVFASLFIIAFSILTYLETHFSSMFLPLLGGLFFILYVGLTIIYWIVVVVKSVRRSFKAAFFALFGALILSFLPLYGTFLNQTISHSIDYVRLSYNEGYYLREIEKRSRETNHPKLVVLNWGAGGFVSTNFFFALVYDESVNFSQSNAQRMEEWKARSQEFRNMHDERCRSHIVRLKEKFYSMSTTCQ